MLKKHLHLLLEGRIQYQKHEHVTVMNVDARLSNITRDHIYLDFPYLAYSVDIFNVYSPHFVENWPCFNETVFLPRQAISSSKPDMYGYRRGGHFSGLGTSGIWRRVPYHRLHHRDLPVYADRVSAGWPDGVDVNHVWHHRPASWRGLLCTRESRKFGGSEQSGRDHGNHTRQGGRQ